MLGVRKLQDSNLGFWRHPQSWRDKRQDQVLEQGENRAKMAALGVEVPLAKEHSQPKVTPNSSGLSIVGTLAEDKSRA